MLCKKDLNSWYSNFYIGDKSAFYSTIYISYNKLSIFIVVYRSILPQEKTKYGKTVLFLSTPLAHYTYSIKKHFILLKKKKQNSLGILHFSI